MSSIKDPKKKDEDDLPTWLMKKLSLIFFVVGIGGGALHLAYRYFTWLATT